MRTDTMHRPAIPPPPPTRDTVPTPPPDTDDDMPWPADGEPASGIRPILSPETAARLRAEWEAAMAPTDPRDLWADDHALDAEVA